MQTVSPLFDSELIALARETRRVAGTVDASTISARLYEIAGEVLGLAYLGDRSNKAELSEACARFEVNEDKRPTA